MSHPELRPKEGQPADVGKSLQEQLAGKVDPSELPETREETRPGKLSGEIAGLLSKMYSEPERYAAFAGQKQRLEEMAGGLVAVDDLSVRRGNAGLREIEAELQEIKQELGLLPGEAEAGGTPAAVPAAESVAASEASSPPPAPAPRPARPTKKPDNGEQARNGEAKENEAVLAAIEEALQRARAFVGSLSREDKRDSAQVRAHAKEIDQADRQLQLAKKTDANLKDAFWRLKVAADIQIIDKNISQCQQVLEAKPKRPARREPRRSDAPASAPHREPEPALAPEVVAEARAQLIDDRAAEIRTKREAGGAEANVEVDARIAAAGAQPFTPEADAIARQWDHEQAAKQIAAEEAARLATPAAAPEPSPAGPEVPENEITARFNAILARLEQKVGRPGKGKPAYYIGEARRLLPGMQKGEIAPEILEQINSLLENLEQLIDAGWPGGKDREEVNANREKWEREVVAKFVQLDKLLRPEEPAAPVESTAASPAAPEAAAVGPEAEEPEESEENLTEAERLRRDRIFLLDHFGKNFPYTDLDALTKKALELGLEVDTSLGRGNDFMTLPGKIRRAVEAKAGARAKPTAKPPAAPPEPADAEFEDEGDEYYLEYAEKTEPKIVAKRRELLRRYSGKEMPVEVKTLIRSLLYASKMIREDMGIGAYHARSSHKSIEEILSEAERVMS